MSGLWLNYCFCEISNDDETVFSIDYKDRDTLRNLRIDYPNVVFYRQGTKVFCWDINGNDFVVSGYSLKAETISKDKMPSIISKMLESKIKALFVETKEYDVYHEKYSHSIVAKKQKPEWSDSMLDIQRCAKVNTYFYRDRQQEGSRVESDVIREYIRQLGNVFKLPMGM